MLVVLSPAAQGMASADLGDYKHRVIPVNLTAAIVMLLNHDLMG